MEDEYQTLLISCRPRGAFGYENMVRKAQVLGIEELMPRIWERKEGSTEQRGQSWSRWSKQCGLRVKPLERDWLFLGAVLCCPVLPQPHTSNLETSARWVTILHAPSDTATCCLVRVLLFCNPMDYSLPGYVHEISPGKGHHFLL